MKEIITAIKKVDGYTPNTNECKDPVKPRKIGIGGSIHGFSTYDGILISTTEQEIFIGVDDNESCCESWGYVQSEDSLDQFIGSLILSIHKVDLALKSTQIALDKIFLDEGGAMFINIETTKGLFQIAAYNSHNGYYGHMAVLVSKQLSTNQQV